MKSFLSFYVPVYKKLLDVKEYVKYFDSKSIGAYYRLLCSRVWRLDVEETLEEGYGGSATFTLAKEYERGNLTAYISDKELSDLLCVSTRHIRRMRSILHNLGLINYVREEKKESAFFYKVGETIKSKEYGKYNEIFFIDRWLKQVDDFKKKNKSKFASTEEIPFVKQLICLLDNSIKLEENNIVQIESELVEFKDNLFDVGHTCPPSWTYMSDIDEENVEKNDVQDGDILTAMKRPNNNSINNNLKNNYQEPLFGEENRVSLEDLVYGASSVSKLGGNLLKAVKEFGYDKVSDFIVMTESNLSGTKTPLADFVMNTFMVKQPQSNIVTLMWQWWIALSLDFSRPTMRSDATRAKMVFSKIPVKNWSEFKYLISLARTKKVQNFQSMETPTWLYNLTQNFVVKLDEFRKQALNMSNAEVNITIAETLKSLEEAENAMYKIVAEKGLTDDLEDFDFDSFEKDFLGDDNG